MNALARRAAYDPPEATWEYHGTCFKCVLIRPTGPDLTYMGERRFSNGDPGFIQRRVADFRAHNLTDVYAMNVSESTTNILPANRLSTIIPITDEITVRGNRRAAADLLYEQLPILNSALYLPMGGCYGLVLAGMTPEGTVKFLRGHLNRRNAIDHRIINEKQKGLTHAGLIHAGVSFLEDLRVVRETIRGCIFGGLDSESFRHSFADLKKGTFHRSMYDRFKKLGYTDAVMAPGSGCISLEAYASETSAKLGLGGIDCLFSISTGNAYASTRDTRPVYRQASNTGLIIFDPSNN